MGLRNAFVARNQVHWSCLNARKLADPIVIG
ncbi:hypothetical protein BRAO375_4180010 [Bradyrhizobium sp. ORS 375]|nr:hypothetical protein BRAO375_4180010 [Bradyrhizobium sp. ORS 375]